MITVESRRAVVVALFACATTIVSFASTRANAHDHWLVARPMVSTGPGEITVALYYGEDLVAEDERPFERARVTRLDDVQANGAPRNLLPLAVDGARPMLRFTLGTAGGHLLALDRNAAFIELPAAKFEEYLREESMPEVIAERARRGESKKPGRERYSRAIKALVQVGTTHDAAFGRILGQEIELVPQSDPTVVAPGERLEVVALFRGQPLARAHVTLHTRVGSLVTSETRDTGVDGSTTFVVQRRAVFLLRTMHMLRCESCAPGEADWESFWTSYSFASVREDGAAVIAPDMRRPIHPPRRSPWPKRMLVSALVIGALLSMGALMFRERRR